MRRATAEQIRTALKKNEAPPFPEWCTKQIILDGKRFSFAGHKPLEEIYTESINVRELSIMKCMQIGLSTWAILFKFYLALALHYDSIYYGPDDDFMKKFSKGRAKTLLKENPFIRKQITDTDTAGLKNLSGALIYYLGLRTEKNVVSVPADAIFCDEVDISDQKLLRLVKDRLGHSSFGFLARFSNPTIPFFGIDKDFQESDMRYWLMKCPKCNTCNDIVGRYPDVYREKKTRSGRRVYLFCDKCGGELDREQGEWVALHPGREKRGYHIAKLYFTFPVRGGDIVEECYRDYVDAEKGDSIDKINHIRNKIGKAAEDSTVRVTNVVLNRCTTEQPLVKTHRGPCYMGIDVGDRNWAIIGHMISYDTIQLHWYEAHGNSTREQWNFLDRLMHDHMVWYCGIDYNPERTKAREFALRHQGRVFLIESRQQKDEVKQDDVTFESQELKILRVNRGDMIDVTISRLEKQRILLAAESDDESIPPIRQHLKNLVRIKQTAKDGTVSYVYVKHLANHLGFALAHMRVAREFGAIQPFGSTVVPRAGKINGSMH